MDTTIVPNKCTHCSCWTATEISHNEHVALIKCTVCGIQHTATWSATETAKFIRDVKKFMKTAAQLHPELARLTTPGTSAVLPMPD